MKPSTAKFLILFSLSGATLLLITCAQSGSKPLTDAELVQRGAYLVSSGLCNDCHSPKKFTAAGPVPDESILLSGHPASLPALEFPADKLDPNGWAVTANAHFTAWAGPWGVSFTANLTPDEKTGLGSWKVEDFIKAMRSGKHMGTGRDILPPMPWPLIGKMSDDDLKAIFAYLQSLPAVPNLVPGPIPPPAAPAQN